MLTECFSSSQKLTGSKSTGCVPSANTKSNPSDVVHLFDDTLVDKIDERLALFLRRGQISLLVVNTRMQQRTENTMIENKTNKSVCWPPAETLQLCQSLRQRR